MRNYEENLKSKIVRLHLEDGRSLKSLSEESNALKISILMPLDDLEKSIEDKYHPAL